MMALGRTALVIAGLIPNALAAQRETPLPTLDSGAVVRFRLPSGRRIAGKLIAPFAPDSRRLRFCLYPAPPCVVGGERYSERLAADLSRLEVRRGTQAIPGLAVGTGLGIGMGFLAADFGESMDETHYSTGKKVRIVALWTFFWAGLGLLIGRGLDRWSSVP